MSLINRHYCIPFYISIVLQYLNTYNLVAHRYVPRNQTHKFSKIYTHDETGEDTLPYFTLQYYKITLCVLVEPKYFPVVVAGTEVVGVQVCVFVFRARHGKLCVLAVLAMTITRKRCFSSISFYNRAWKMQIIFFGVTRPLWVQVLASIWWMNILYKYFQK